MPTYAERTTVVVDKSKTDISKLLAQRGAVNEVMGTVDGESIVAFERQGIRFMFRMRLPQRGDDDMRFTAEGKTRTTSATVAAMEQETRRLYRALLLVLKAKFESVDSGIETIEQAFMANIVLPSGQTMGEWAVPQIRESYRNNQMPPMLGHRSDAIPLNEGNR